MKVDLTKLGTLFNSFILLVGVVGGLYAGYVWVGNEGKKEAVQEQLMFPDAETTQRTIIHVKDSEEVIDELKDLLKTTTKDGESRIHSRAIRDSIQEEYLDLARRNAVSAHQNKQGIDSVLKLWNNYNEGNDE